MFSTGIGTWSNFSNASLHWASGSGEGGSGALVATSTGSNMAVASGTFGAGGLTSASPGQIYSGSIAAESPAGSDTMQPVLSFYSATGSAITAVFGPDTTVGKSAWAPLSPAVAIAPANTAYVQLAVIAYGGTGITAVFDDAWIEQTGAATTPSVVGPLTTSGNQIVQSNGKPVTLRGIVLNGLEANASSSFVTQQAVVQAKAWGANIIRLPLADQFWLSSNCDYSSSYASTVGQVVNWITSLGMVALLDLHYNTVNGCETGTQHNMADEAQAPTFWSQVAGQFGSNPLVAFDLYNEPHDISDAVWLNGGQTTDIYPPYETFTAAGMQQLYNTVRATGTQNLVFISGTNWANTVPAQLVQGTNIVYEAHIYTCMTMAACQAGLPADYDPSPYLSHFVPLSSSMPVVVSEFGWPNQADGTYISNVVSYAGSHGWGWIAFAWEDTPYPSPFDLTSGWSANSPVQPSPSGIPVLCAFIVASTAVSPCSAPSFASSSDSTTQNSPSKTTGPPSPSGGPNSIGTGFHGMTVGGFGAGSAGAGSDTCGSSCGSSGGSHRASATSSGQVPSRAAGARRGAPGSIPDALVGVGLFGLIGAVAALSRRTRRLSGRSLALLWASFRTAWRRLLGDDRATGALGDVRALPG